MKSSLFLFSLLFFPLFSIGQNSEGSIISFRPKNISLGVGSTNHIWQKKQGTNEIKNYNNYFVDLELNFLKIGTLSLSIKAGHYTKNINKNIDVAGLSSSALHSISNCNLVYTGLSLTSFREINVAKNINFKPFLGFMLAKSTTKIIIEEDYQDIIYSNHIASDTSALNLLQYGINIYLIHTNSIKFGFSLSALHEIKLFQSFLNSSSAQLNHTYYLHLPQKPLCTVNFGFSIVKNLNL